MKKNKQVLFFLLRFFVSYTILAGLYQWYLTKNQEKEPQFSCSPITRIVTDNSVCVGNALGLKFRSEQHKEELSFKLFTNDHYVARIVEGCNSISVILLFWSFIIAFAGAWKKTLLFGLIGGALIYVLNIFRIVFIAVALDKYPQHSQFLHQILFPAIIYGFTFLLWIIWVKYFATKKTTKNENDHV